MSGLDGKGSSTPNGINIPRGKFFVDGIAINTPDTYTKAGVATNGAIVITSTYNIGGFTAMGFTSAGVPVAIGTAVVAGKVLTITPTAGGVATDKWNVQTWA